MECVTRSVFCGYPLELILPLLTDGVLFVCFNSLSRGFLFHLSPRQLQFFIFLFRKFELARAYVRATVLVESPAWNFLVSYVFCLMNCTCTHILLRFWSTSILWSPLISSDVVLVFFVSHYWNNVEITSPSSLDIIIYYQCAQMRQLCVGGKGWREMKNARKSGAAIWNGVKNLIVCEWWTTHGAKKFPSGKKCIFLLGDPIWQCCGD